MRFWFALILAFTFGPALAGAAIVNSGEHPGFTRIVMQFDRPVNWQVGRTMDGYALRIQGDRQNYDISKAFDLIGKGRLAALWADPSTGDLHLGIACACYAMPFEFRPGIVVVDLHDGAPPKGSEFEQPLDAPLAPAVLSVSTVPPAPSYDWADLAVRQMGLEPGKPVETANPRPPTDNLVTFDPSLEPLRLSLFQQMSRGASQGIVEMTMPEAAQDTEHATGDPSVLIHLGETPGLVVRQKGEGDANLTAHGGQCFSDDQLDISVWGSPRPVSDQIGPERQGLTVEFDKPDPDAVARAVRFNLFLGFGAEARGLLRAFPGEFPDVAIWQSMARILDDEGEASTAFIGMEDCDTAAALWAVLATPDVTPKDEIGKASVLRSFSALPPHLRRLLGPRLVERFLGIKDLSAATALRDAVLRAPGDPGPGVVLMEARYALATGKPDQSEAALAPLANAAGPSANDALVALVEQRAMMGQSITYDQVLALEEALKERQGGAEGPRFQRALLLARAGSGDFDGAFAEIDKSPEALPILWQMLSRSGPDSALLSYAVLPEGNDPPPAAKESAGIIAARLLDLGLPAQAERWLGLATAVPDLLKARLRLAMGDPQGTLELLMDDQSAPALAVKADALLALGNGTGAAAIYDELGKADAKWSALSRSQAWDAMAKDGPENWKAVADVIVPPVAPLATEAAPATTDGPLARNKALVDESAATRDAITSLLNSVGNPAPPTQ